MSSLRERFSACLPGFSELLFLPLLEGRHRHQPHAAAFQRGDAAHVNGASDALGVAVGEACGFCEGDYLSQGQVMLGIRAIWHN